MSKNEINTSPINSVVIVFIVLTIVFYFASTIFFFVIGDFLIGYYWQDVSADVLNLYSIISILSFINFIFAIVLLGKRKIGFWGLTITSLLASYYIYKISLLYAVVPLLLVAVIYSFLQIKYQEKTAWKSLK